MIESLKISDIATYKKQSPQEMNDLSQFNYIFGSNGTGKTTISKLIAEPSKFINCNVTWKNDTQLQTLVYNQDFVNSNFAPATKLKGIFTLGEEEIDRIDEIETAKREVDKLEGDIQGLANTLDRKNKELNELESEFKAKCWEQKKKHDTKLRGPFEGFHNSTKNFKNKIIQESTNNNASLEILDVLEKQAKIVFEDALERESLISNISVDSMIAHESNPILEKKIVGKSDIDIAAMIQKLGNSDWVRQGLDHFNGNNNICPFCQQQITEAFEKSLNEYFDETFENDTETIAKLITNYKNDAGIFQQNVQNIIELSTKFLDTEQIKEDKKLLDSIISNNIQSLENKAKEPSNVTNLKSLSQIAERIKNIIDTANENIEKHNTIVSNLTTEKKQLTAQVWKYLLEELKTDLDSYQTKKSSVQKAIFGLTKRIDENKKSKTTKEDKIKDLEKKATSIQPTINAINQLLESFGFDGFSFASVDNSSYYKLVRADGTDAKDTLSEGEKSFVTFLYFYNLLKGSNSENGMTTDRIVVFDYPVSSLDSDILFIVSSLIKKLCEEVRETEGYIKQIFILTHNVYFHKEITFNQKRSNEALNEETFWVVRKNKQGSQIEKYESNPIKTSYELLWAEVKKEDHSSLTIQNTLRRILENYFKILGGINFDDVSNKFTGKEKVMCKSLFSWVNDGSHSIHEDLYVSSTDIQVESYLDIFKDIFDKTGHLAHYDMMMG
ncbi:AAA family ATPase [Methanococcoides seepicolus]|uniref:AAA family ATPase n=1 Tax=Methanococcoides seepicolus TaxID=2828780 RepID=A0A9E4ZJX7_9EURY|nr:AAA family ATPase [Methanococcoides seepicolus]MCM1987983.1 AAA family ATPase [Methanococcoides seepicolus]